MGTYLRKGFFKIVLDENQKIVLPAVILIFDDEPQLDIKFWNFHAKWAPACSGFFLKVLDENPKTVLPALILKKNSWPLTSPNF